MNGVVGLRDRIEAGIRIRKPDGRSGGGGVFGSNQGGQQTVERVGLRVAGGPLIGVQHFVQMNPHIGIRGTELVDHGAEIIANLAGRGAVRQIIDPKHDDGGVREIVAAGVAESSGVRRDKSRGLPGPIEQGAAAEIVSAISASGQGDPAAFPCGAPAVVAVVKVVKRLAIDRGRGDRAIQIGTTNRTGELVAGGGIDRHSAVGQMLEHGIAVAGVVAVAALGDGVTHEDERAIMPRHGAGGEKRLRETFADGELRRLVEMQRIVELRLQIQIAERIDGGAGGGAGGLVGADRVAVGPGSPDATGHAVHGRGVGQIHPQVVHQRLQAGTRCGGLGAGVTFPLKIEQADNFKGITLGGERGGGGVDRGHHVIIHVVIGRVLEPERIAPAAAAGLDDAEVAHSRPVERAGERDFRPPMRGTTAIVAALLALQRGERAARIAERGGGIGEIAPPKLDLRVGGIGAGRGIRLAAGGGAQRVGLAGEDEEFEMGGLGC